MSRSAKATEEWHAKLEPWSEERDRRCKKWMKQFVGRYRIGFPLDVQEYFDRYVRG